ncbi:hypothetical protein D9601_02535 [Sphingomonas sp. MA1305]|uniref:HNH endonuclease n=1 Tax=Sphingomonas sp. MA1305 TaxID=2479204 RepID=UPI0018E03A99|nr:HNH endonuclease [Sphingomonas sp. MA1305]MBI0474242.1 hypothetical protein [Sphingomonas sp. MA1305]
MKLIPATLGYSAIVDDEDFERLAQFRWYAHNCGGKSSTHKRPARRTSVAEGRNVLFLVHHIMRAPIGMVVDHINGDPWDNRKANLRVCSPKQNVWNQRRKHRGELPKGVYKRGSRYWSKIAANRTNYDLGCYDTAEEAGLAYDAAALFLHGKFAALNYPDRGTVATDPVIIGQSWERARASEPSAEVQAALALMSEGLNSRIAAERTGAPRSILLRHAAGRGVAAPRGRPRKDHSEQERAA